MKMAKARERKSSSKNHQATIARLPHASNVPFFHVRSKNSEVEKSPFLNKVNKIIEVLKILSAERYGIRNSNAEIFSTAKQRT
jgi:hypothetical protein